MALVISHPFVSGKSDGVDTTLVQPSNWNASHALSMATAKVLGRATAGTGSIEELAVTGTGSVVLADSAALTGTPTAPTVGSPADNTTKLATTAFVQSVFGGGTPGFAFHGNFTPNNTTNTTGLNVNGNTYNANGVKTMIAVIAVQNSTGNNTASAILMLRFHYDGNAAPAVTQIAYDAGGTGIGACPISFGVSGTSLTVINSAAANSSVSLFGCT